MSCSSFVLLATLALAAIVTAASDDLPSERDDFVEIPRVMEFSGRIIAKPRAGAGLALSGNELARGTLPGDLASYTIVWRQDDLNHLVLDLPAEKAESEAARELMATGLFEFVEPDWTLYPVECPNDSAFGNQWHHGSTRMRSCEAWDLHTGSSTQTVAICDTGVQTNHPDLLLNRKEGYNAVDRLWESQGGEIGPVHPHGTQTTGCAAANGNNGTGVSGVGWNLGHRMMRVSNNPNGGASMSTLTHAAVTAIRAGDRVASVSYAGVGTPSVRSAANQIRDLGGLLFWAAGNDGANLDWGDRDADNVIVVGATNANDRRPDYSAFGRSVDLVAPGSLIYTTSTGSSYGSVSGTSLSAPLAAGLAALVWSANPGLTPDEVEAVLKAGCDDLGDAGVDDTFGHGRINSQASLLLAGAGCIADFNGDGAVNTQDVVAFLNAFASGDPEADVNGDGSINTQDVIAFLNAWSEGCP